MPILSFKCSRKRACINLGCPSVSCDQKLENLECSRALNRNRTFQSKNYFSLIMQSKTKIKDCAQVSTSGQAKFQTYKRTLSKLKLSSDLSKEGFGDCILTEDQRNKKITEDVKHPVQISLLKDIVLEKPFHDFFRLESKIGEGAHSVVHKCLDLHKNNVYAVKTLKRNDPELVEGMKQSYEIMKMLNHQYILQAKFLFIQEKLNICHMVTSYYSYPDLRNYIDEQQQLITFFEEKTVADVIYKILVAVAFMHDKKICHRDIKPENILYDPVSKNMKIIDFEISRMQTCQDETLELWSNTGTINYRAPESFDPGYSYEVDLWAIGIIAYEMLTGNIPFMSPYQSKMKEKIIKQEIDFELLKISKLAQKFLSKLLAKDPRQRMTASQALADPFIIKYVSVSFSTCTSPMSSSLDPVKTASSDSNDSDTQEKTLKLDDQHLIDSFIRQPEQVPTKRKNPK